MFRIDEWFFLRVVGSGVIEVFAVIEVWVFIAHQA